MKIPFILFFTSVRLRKVFFFSEIFHGDIFISFSHVLVVYKRNIRIVMFLFFFDGIQVYVCLLRTDPCIALANKRTS